MLYDAVVLLAGFIAVAAWAAILLAFYIGIVRACVIFIDWLFDVDSGGTERREDWNDRERN